MNTLQQFAKSNSVKPLQSAKASTLKGGGIANGKNGCPIGYEPNDPLKFMEKMERKGSSM